MSIQEILEAHDDLYFNNLNNKFYCDCGLELGDKSKTYYMMDSTHRVHVAEVLDKYMQEREAQMRQLIRDMTDPGACWFDHHGGCQEHGYLELKPGELCPHAEAKQLLGDEPNGR